MSTETSAAPESYRWLDWDHDAESVYDRVHRGLAWLRTEGARFACNIERVNLRWLVMSRTDSCVLGQASEVGTYWAAMDRIHGHGDYSPAGVQARRDWAVAHGFWAYEGDWDALTDVWREVLAPESEPQLTV